MNNNYYGGQQGYQDYQNGNYGAPAGGAYGGSPNGGAPGYGGAPNGGMPG